MVWVGTTIGFDWMQSSFYETDCSPWVAECSQVPQPTKSTKSNPNNKSERKVSSESENLTKQNAPHWRMEGDAKIIKLQPSLDKCVVCDLDDMDL